MTKTNDARTTELLSRPVAAELLARQLDGKSADQWALWLRNNANTARAAVYRIPVESIGRGSFYQPAELEKFIEFEKSRQLGTIKLAGRAAEALRAFGVGEGGSTQGRPWKGASANVASREGSGSAFVQAIVNEPLLVFALTVDQAIEFGTELADAGRAARRINNSGKGVS